MKKKSPIITCTCGQTIPITPNLHDMNQAIVNHAKTHNSQDIKKTIDYLTIKSLDTIASIPQ